MARTITVLLGGVLAVGLLVTALWGWQHAPQVAAGWGAANRGVAVWAVYSAAVGVAAAAQIILLSLVLENLYEPDALGDMLKLVAGLLSTLALVGAVALGLASR